MKSNCNYKELQKFAKKIEKMGKQENIEKLYEDCLKELAARFLRKVKMRTPVALTQYEDVVDEGGNLIRYTKGKKKGQVKQQVAHRGGTLRKAWNVKEITKNGSYYTIVIENPTPYAGYVNYGHRQTPGRFVKALGKRLKASWVDGQFFLEISEIELERIMPAFLNKKLDEYVKECFNDD